MSNENKAPPRKPDFEIAKVHGAAWDNQADGGDISATFRITFRKIQDRIQDAKENARDAGEDDRRDDKRSESSRSGREDRRDRNTAPRYER